jgi:hypothetical protein
MTLLPRNATELERALETSMARLADVPVPLRDLWNPDTWDPHHGDDRVHLVGDRRRPARGRMDAGS